MWLTIEQDLKLAAPLCAITYCLNLFQVSVFTRPTSTFTNWLFQHLHLQIGCFLLLLTTLAILCQTLLTLQLWTSFDSWLKGQNKKGKTKEILSVILVRIDACQSAHCEFEDIITVEKGYDVWLLEL